MRVSLMTALTLGMLFGGRAVPRSAQERSAHPAGCAEPEYRQFDFWLGDWNVFESDGTTAVGRVRVDKALDGCALLESYEDRKGLTGHSISAYDRSRNVWHQTWATNQGQLLSIEGRTQAVDMVLSGTYRGARGEETNVRGTWRPLGETVRETAVTSTDGGKTWKPWFDLLFRPRGGSTQTNTDRKAVADLDTRYQAAVKQNDAATMDRLLADDFILITGAGKVFAKAELLADARSGQTTYEHQEDTDQVVRIWGDTAVVTARLWEKGVKNGKPFDATLWFSDTYVRTPLGWRYVFGQASLPIAKPPQ